MAGIALGGCIIPRDAALSAGARFFCARARAQKGARSLGNERRDEALERPRNSTGPITGNTRRHYRRCVKFVQVSSIVRRKTRLFYLSLTPRCAVPCVSRKNEPRNTCVFARTCVKPRIIHFIGTREAQRSPYLCKVVRFSHIASIAATESRSLLFLDVCRQQSAIFRATFIAIHEIIRNRSSAIERAQDAPWSAAPTANALFHDFPKGVPLLFHYVTSIISSVAFQR